MDIDKPLRNHNILVQEIGEEVFLYNPDDDALHVLNATALSVWHQCDGSHTLEAIAAHLRATYQVPEETNTYKDVLAIVQKFSELGVLV